MDRGDRVLLEVKTTRTGEETQESMMQFLASLTGLRKRIARIVPVSIPISIEIGVIDQSIHFFLSVPSSLSSFVESQLVSQYPKASISKAADPFSDFKSPSQPTLSLGQMKLASGFLYPIRTYKEFKDVDPMSSLLSVLSHATAKDRIWIQFLLVPVSSSWQRSGERAAAPHKDSTGHVENNPKARVIQEKIAYAGFKTAIRIAVLGESKERSKHLLYEIANSFSSYNNPAGNRFVFSRAILWQGQRLLRAMKKRSKRFVPTGQILNVMELSTILHLPTMKLATLQNISWHKTILSEPPETLPVAENLTDEEKEEINFFAKTQFKNREQIFGIRREDRRKHMYIIGKSGTGKSTLIANLAIDDMRKKRGFCVIDPHGDLSNHLLDFVPSYRVNDIIYLDPSEIERSFAINPLEVTNESQKELVASGIVAIFKKLYGNSWGPRLEYHLRNAIVSVMQMPNPTLLMVPEVLTNAEFRQKVVDNLKDPVLKSYWINEYENMTERLRAESISSILNKVGQFTSSERIRNIIGHPKSTIDIEKVINDGKILILNLSQGYLGEDNAALLGAMIITKIQLAAMNRVSIAEEDRKDFYLYVDEFQNFATTSFIKILSEARKYRLNLILANQYIAQIPEDVRAAIFGNAGTMMSFLIGAEDSRYMAREFGERFKEEDLLSLGNYQAILKLSIKGMTQSPFLCYTLPLPQSITQNREKVIKISRERYTREIKS